MTKKDFIAIAAVLNANHAPLSLVLDFADMCAEQNVLFDRERFVRASTELLKDDLDYAVRALSQQRDD